MTTALATLTSKLAARFDMGDGEGVTEILKNTAFKVKDGAVSDNQMAALLVIANQYGLNPFTKEIYAYPDKSNGIVPVVGVDGWGRIINERPELDGLEFRYSEQTLTHKGRVAHEWIECVITRKDRKVPIIVREYFDEVVRNLSFPTPWDTHPKRMHRHKAMIQCARIAFGFGGIYDQDEAERIAEIEINPMPANRSAPKPEPAVEAPLPSYPADDFAKNLPTWRKAIESGKATADQIIARSSTKYTLNDEQKAAIQAPIQPAHVDEDGVIDADFVREFEGASND
jgi:phage recombination protein Bet